MRHAVDLPEEISLSFGEVSGNPAFDWAAYHIRLPYLAGRAEHMENQSCVAIQEERL